MSQLSPIEWTDATWNPSTGCTVVSSGCKFCYAEKMAARLQAMGSARYTNGFAFTMHFDKVDEPRGWRKPRKIFVNSMSDLFHEEVSIEFLAAVFRTMVETPWHQYQVLTKRPDRAAALLGELSIAGVYRPAPHIWLGTSVEDARVLHRIDSLRSVPAAVRFLSCEPLIGPLGPVDLQGIDWVIVGGESGTHLSDLRIARRRALAEVGPNRTWQPRSDRMDWVREIRDQAVNAGTAFFFKQWGGLTPKAGGRLLDGRTWDEYPGLAREPSSHVATSTRTVNPTLGGGVETIRGRVANLRHPGNEDACARRDEVRASTAAGIARDQVVHRRHD